MSGEHYAVLASGGMDSFLAWNLLRKREGVEKVTNVFVDIGQGYRNKELQAISNLEAIEGFEVVILKGPDLGFHELPSGIIPNRNAALILSAALISNRIALGVLKHEINSDKSPEFFAAMKAVLDISNRGQYWNGGQGTSFEIFSPLCHWTKTKAVADYLEWGGAPKHLHATVSCYSPTGGRCGRCPSCFKRWVALLNNGLDEYYEAHPLIWAQENGIIQKCHDGTYGPERAEEILSAVARVGLP